MNRRLSRIPPELFLIVALAILAAIGWSQTAPVAPIDALVLSVNKLPVYSDEFLWHLQQERPGVIHDVQTTRHCVFGSGFWNIEFDGTTPRKQLLQKTIERVAREKIEQEFYTDLGILPNPSFSSFLQLMDETNNERARAKQEGRIVYGPVKYSQLQFYDHWKANLRLKAGQCIARKDGDPSPDQIRDFHEKRKSAFYSSSGSVTLEIIVLRPCAPVSDPNAQVNIHKGLKEILERLGKGEPYSQVANTYNRERLNISAARFDDAPPDRIAEFFQNDSFTSQILALPLNEWRTLQTPAGAFIVRCVRRNPPGPVPLDDIIQRVRADWLDCEYQRQLDERIRNARIHVNQTRLDSIAFE